MEEAKIFIIKMDENQSKYKNIENESIKYNPKNPESLIPDMYYDPRFRSE